MPSFMRLDRPIELYKYYCGIRTFKKDDTHEVRMPEFSTLLLVFSGTLSFTEDGKRVDVHAGSYYIQRAGTKQGGVPISDPPIYGYVHFIAEFTETDKEAGIPVFGSINTDKMRYEMLQLTALRDKHITDKEDSRFYSETIYRFYKILHILQKSKHTAKNDTAVKIHDYIAANASSVASIDDLSRHFNYSREHISRIFKSEYGISPHKFIVQTRIETACILIKTTNLTVAQIAETCGYNDFSVFWRSFKSVTGKSPLQIKNDENFDI